MSRHYRELLVGHITSETVYHRPPYTVAIVETEWPTCGGETEPTRITGCGVAKHNPADTEAGRPYDERLGELLAIGRAYQDAWEQAEMARLNAGNVAEWLTAFCANAADALADGFAHMAASLRGQ